MIEQLTHFRSLKPFSSTVLPCSSPFVQDLSNLHFLLYFANRENAAKHSQFRLMETPSTKLAPASDSSNELYVIDYIQANIWSFMSFFKYHQWTLRVSDRFLKLFLLTTMPLLINSYLIWHEAFFISFSFTIASSVFNILLIPLSTDCFLGYIYPLNKSSSNIGHSSDCCQYPPE